MIVSFGRGTDHLTVIHFKDKATLCFKGSQGEGWPFEKRAYIYPDEGERISPEDAAELIRISIP
jgi:hypothetical protein